MNDRRILLTGATGFIGSHIMAALLGAGHKLIITGRPSGGDSLKTRIDRLLQWFGIDCDPDNIIFYETDFLKKDLGLDEEEYRSLASSTGRIIHCASDTSFSEKNRDRIMKSNVENLNEILKLAEISSISGFHYISTVYAAGLDHEEVDESPVTSMTFVNVYEESKAAAERTLAETCLSKSIPYSIIRPSIVYGDSVTGRSLKFNALYYPVMAVSMIKDIYYNDIKSNNGNKAVSEGIKLHEDGSMDLPIRIFLPYEGKLNLIPVDYFADVVLSIISEIPEGKIYNVTSDRPVSITLLAEYTSRLLKIHGLETFAGSSTAEGLRNAPEEIFDHYIRQYRPYLSDRRNFTRHNTDSVTGNRQVPPLTYESFERCMNYAIGVDWGKNIFRT